jgi:biopolymer transport protein ExbB
MLRILPVLMTSRKGFFSGPYFRSITIDHTKVAADLTDFPLMIQGTYSYLKTLANGGKVQSSNGYDIQFYSDSLGTTLLDFEIEHWNDTTGDLTAWVKVPSVSSTVDTDIYIRYGDSAIVSDTSNAPGVWAEYEAVWHLAKNGSTSGVDSTGNGHTGSFTNSPTSTAGKINEALELDQTYYGGPFQNMEGSSAIPVSNTAFTITAWHKLSTFLSDSPTIFHLEGSNRTLYFQLLGTTTMWVNIPGSIGLSATVADMTNAWTYSSITRPSANGNLKLYHNGSYQDQAFINQFMGTISGWSIGGAIGLPSYSYTYEGAFDEIRICAVERPAAWISSEYNNQDDPATFYTISAEL